MPDTNEVSQTNDARYPTGRFAPPETITAEDRRYAILTIAETPEQLREAVRSLSEHQLDTPYRAGGWTVRQVVHHLADSHMASLHRLCRALTEEQPTVQGYHEAAFAELPDHKMPIEWSLNILEGVHARWVTLLNSMDEAQWKRTWNHSERGLQRLDVVTLLYAWHCRHHVAHITHLRAQQGW
ncbi:MAG TPA: putative metal-dependent hydrolase [Acidobacteriaceae bacterium]|nr:putative metal-dependent hydrolase [Acidobacteriaceae bacterium]